MLVKKALLTQSHNSSIKGSQLVLIDNTVPDIQTLLEGLPEKSAVRIVQSCQDGLFEISRALAESPAAVTSLHIISHAISGSFRLGSTDINLQTLTQYSDTIRGWSKLLAADAEILLYGCNLAQNAEGKLFVETFSSLIGLPVAASETPTGHADLDGDWQLQFKTGAMVSRLAVSEATQKTWQGLLEDPVYGEEQVNTFTPNDQSWPEAATLNDGSYVVTWISYTQDGDSWGIYAQRFSNNGVATGPEFKVNTLTNGGQSWPHIAALSNGGFVITWHDDAGNDGSDSGVFGQRFNAAGVAQGSQFLLNTTTSSTQYHDNVAAYTNGFATVWSSYGNVGGDATDIYLQRFDNDGNKLGVETLVSTNPGTANAQGSYQYVPDVAAYTNGNLVIVWNDAYGNDGSGNGVYGRLYNAGTNTFSDTFLVNTTTAGEQSYYGDGSYAPNVAVLANGNFVVVWPSNNNDGSGWAVMAQRFDAGGNKLGGEFLVNETTAGSQYQSEITALSTGGFVISFYNDNYDLSGTGSTSDVYIRQYDAAGNALGGQQKANTPGVNYTADSTPAVTDLGNGNFAVLWTGNNQESDAPNTNGIFQQLFGNAGELPRPSANPELGDFGGTLNLMENAVNAAPQVLDAAVSLSDSDSANFDGGRIIVFFTSGGAAEDQLTVVNEGNLPGQIGLAGNAVSYSGTQIGTLSGGTNGSNLEISLNANATVDAVEELIQKLGYLNTSSTPNATRTVGIRVEDGDGGSTTGGIVTINVTQQLDGTPKAYGEQQVNTYIPNSQSDAAVATLSGGSYVVVWTSASGQDGSADGVYAQRYNASGVAIGPEFRVNTNTAGNQNNPSVTGLSDGSFIVAWADDSNGADGSSWGVFAQRFNADGVAQGGEFLVNTFTANDQGQAKIAAYNGGFVATWYSNGEDNYGYGVYSQRFTNAGVKDGAETQVSSNFGSYQYEPDVAARADGSYVIVWRSDSQDGSGAGVYGQRFDADGNPVDSEFQVNTTTVSNQYQPRVAMLTDGGFVVVWSDDGGQDGSGNAVFAQRYNADGSTHGGQFQVNQYTYGSQYQPVVIGLSTGGFVVSFYNDNWGSEGTYSDVYVREYDAAGNPVDGDRQINTPANNYYYSSQSQPALADLGNGNYVTVWTSDGLQDGSSNGIYQQLFGDTTELPRQANPVLSDFVGTVTFDENVVNAGLQVIDAAVGLTDSDSANFNGGRLDLYYLTGASSEDQLGVVNQGNAAGQIGIVGNTVSYGGTAIGTLSGGTNGTNLRIDFNSNAATPDAVEALIQRLGYSNTDTSPNASRTLGLRIADGDGGSSTPNVLTINVTPQLDGTSKAYGEEQVNTYIPNSQSDAAVATLSGGGYVVVWTSASGQDGSAEGVYAQRYNASGVAIGPEFRVNTTTANGQNDPAVAGLSDGSFVVTWQDNNGTDGSSWGVFGQRYDAGGAALGSEFLINTYTDSEQSGVKIAAFDGGFVTTWTSWYQDGYGYGIYSQRFTNAGVKDGIETQVHTTNTYSQYGQDVAARADGSYVIVWQSDQDGSGFGVYGQRFDAGGNPIGTEFQVNTTTTVSNQYQPRVAMLTDGGFVVVWADDGGQDGSGNAVFAQRYNADGSTHGGQFRVNEFTAGSQYQPAVIGLSTGGFVVSFYNDNWGSEGTYSDVYVREYDAAGNPVDGDRQINTPANNYYYSSQSQPALADLGNGNYVTVWTSDGLQDGSSNGIYQQLFGNTTELPRQANPDLADFVGTVTFDENVVNAGLQVIDPAVSLTDSDSVNFNGGRLDLYYLTGASSEDQLGVVSQGNAAGQIGIAGNTVSYGGTAIGTLSGGTNGTNLRIDFNSNAATPDAVEALIQRLGYSNTDSSPNASRTLGLRVSDGDGGSSTPNVLTINVTPQLDGTPKAYGEEQVNTYTYDYQHNPEVAKLSDGGYVVVWTSRSQDSSGDADGVYAQRYNASGVAVGPEFRVPGLTGATQDYAHVAGLSNGGFVITWEDSAGTDGSEWGVFGQLYNSAGVAQGPQFLVNTYTDNTQAYDAVTAYDGGFATVWSSYGNPGGDSYDIYMQRWNNTGSKDGGELRVSDVTPPPSATAQTYLQYWPDIAAQSNGDLMIVWRDDAGYDGNSAGVFARFFDAGTASFGDTFLVNTGNTAGAQYEPKVAALADGGYVIVWRDDNHDGSGAAVMGQRYDAAGNAVGSQFQVNEYTYGSQYMPDVIGLSTGGFVVSFYNDNIGPDGGYNNAYLREYDASGNPVDGDRLVNAYIDNGQGQYQSAMTDLGKGNYVVVWRSDAQDGSYSGIYQQLFGDTTELPRQANPLLDDVTANRVLGSAEAITAHIIDPNVQVQDNDSVNFDGGSLWAYFTSGQGAADTLAINNQGSGALQIGVSGSNVTFGGTVIGTFAGGTGGTPLVVTFDADATPEAVRYLVQNLTYQYNDVNQAPVGSRTMAFRLFDGDGGASLPATTTITIQPSAPSAVLSLADLEPSVTLAESAAQLGVVLDTAVQFTAGAAGFNNGTLTVSYLSGSARPEDQLSIHNQGSGTNQVGFNAGTGEVSFQGIVIGTVNAADTGTNGDQLVITFNASATAQAVERVIENLSYQTTSDGPLASRTIQVQVTDAASATTSQTMMINITPEPDGAQRLFGDEQVNTYIANEQYYPFVTGLEGANAGSYVVVWQSQYEDGSGWGIYGQRYNAQGVQVGTEFQVNTYAASDQTEAKLASLADGGFVVVWRSEGQDGSSGGVYAQRYGSDGAPASSEFQVSTAVASYDQTHPNAIGLANGNFVIVWADQYRDTSSYGSYAHIYAPDGTPIGSDFLINTYLPNEQYVPYLAALKDDPGTGGTDETGFIAVWESNGQDGSSWGVYAQRFDTTGTKAGSEFLVNTNTSSGQVNPDVAVLNNSHIVVVWHDQSDASIRGQLYTAGGVTIGGEFTVSTSDYNSDQGQWPHVTSLANGGFVVSWDGYSSPTDGDYGVYAQQFDANGAKVDGPLQLNATTANYQYFPNVAGLTGGNFVAVWEGQYHETDGNSSHGIFQGLFGTPGSIVHQASPELIDLETSVSYNENDVNAAGQIIDPGVRVVDTDSANFNGGRLVVSVISGYGSNQAFNPTAPQQDNFSIRNQGSGATEVGFNSGTGVVSYGGTAIGSIVSNGQNGADLVVQFNTSSTAQAVEAVVENLTYRNSVSDPTATRTVSIVVSDGAGGQSAPRTIDINVAAQTDGAVRLLAEDQLVNTYTANDQTLPMIAALQGGNHGQYVIVWQSNGQDSDNWGVFGQRYDVNGSAIGPEFQVNTTTPGAQYGQNIVGIGSLTNGGFVVAWESPDAWDYGIFAQRYDAAGQPVGGEFQVNPTTEYVYTTQVQPRVLGLDGGAFIIAYADNNNADGNSSGVRVQHYDGNGVAQGDPVTVNTYIDNNQSFPQLAKLNDGGYVVVWESYGQDGSDWGVFAQRMNADGTVRGSEIPVNTYTANTQGNADVATLANGDFVVSWLSNNPGTGGWSIVAQRFTDAGVKVGGEVLVNNGNTAPNGDTYTQIAALENGGYVITWSAYPAVNDHDVYAQQFDAAGNKIDAPLLLNNYTSSTQYRPDIAGLTGDRFVAAWQSYSQDGSVYGIYQGLFGPAGSLTRSAAPQISDLTTSITVQENAANAAAGVLIDPAVSVSDMDSPNFDGGRLTVSVISGYSSLGSDLSQNTPLQDQFSIRNQGSAFGQVGFNTGTGAVSYGGTQIGAIVSGFDGQNGVDLVIQFNANASTDAVEAVIENLTYRNSSSDPVASRLASVMLTDGESGSSVPRTVQINVTPEADGAIPLFTSEQVNTYTTSTQAAPAMAKLADGGYVTLWQSYGQDGWGWGIFGQRFAADGTRVGNEFRVNDYTPYDQGDANYASTLQSGVAVAGLNDGGFMAVYRGQYRDASGDAVIGQRFDVNGLRVGGEFVVNTTSDGDQYQPAITALADGGFAVAWRSDGVRDGQYADVFFQRYNAAGQAVGVETRANTSTGFENNAQLEPSIIQLGNGDILVAWRSNDQDGSLSGVYAQRFDSSTGAAIGSEFQLNVYTGDYQWDPKLAPTSTGFVAVWTSRGQDGSDDGIYARLYDNSGNPVSNEFRVNETSYSRQWEPSVASVANGGFAVSWGSYNSSNGQYDIYSQQFDALGNRVDGEIRLDANSSSLLPVVVGLNNGNFVVSWQGYSDASDSGIYQRIVGNPADFPRQIAPEIVDLASSVTFLENQINDAPRLIDAGIGLIDPDSTNFAGGRLDVSYVTPYGNPDQFDIPGINAQDQLGIRNEGTGVNQIGVSGSSVSYNDGTGAVVIGSILSDGVNGKPLTVLFNTNATPEAAEALIENLTYQNFLSNPEPSRTISLSLSDGDGGVTAPHAITINITAQPDGAVPFGSEKVVNTTTPGTQEAPAIAYLSNDNYVVVWQDQNGQDGSAQGVFARVYDSNDNPLGDQFQVNTTTESTQWQPKVVALQGGGFTVAWAGYNQIGSTGYDIVGRQFDNSGAPTGGEFVINNPAAVNVNNEQSQPDLAALHNGGFVAVWYANYDESNNNSAEIWGQRFDNTGVKDGGVFHVNTSAGFEGQEQGTPSVTTLADGRFVVVWHSYAQDSSSYGVYGQRFNADGTPDGSEFRANTYTANGQYQQDVTALNDGGYVVVWGSDSNQDTSGWGVYGQRYDAAGAAVGGEFRVNYTVSGTQYQPAVSSLVNGGFVVSWTDGREIWLQQYDASGRKVDSQQAVNAGGNSDHNNTPDLVSTPDGGFIVTYGGYNYSNSNYDVFLQRFSNTAPTIQDVSVVGPEDTAIILTDELFAAGFSDAEGQTLAAIKIVTLPASGILKLDGNNVAPGQIIGVADLAANKLTYLGTQNFNGPDQFRWNGSDGNVFATASVFTNITVNNVNDGPALEAGADGTALEGTFFTHVITIGDPDTANTELVTVSWAGSGGQTGGYQFFTSPGTPSIGLTLPDDGAYTVTVTANDQQGKPNSIETDSFNVTVANVAPTIDLSGNNTVEQGLVYTLSLANPYDPGTDTVSEYHIDWGDGTPVQVILSGDVPLNREVTHTYASAGTPTISVNLVDEDGTFTNAGSKAITVAPPAEVIVVDAGPDTSANEGTLFIRNITFTDPADQDPAGRNVTVDWGDGTAAENFRIGTGDDNFNIQHVFADNRVTPYTVNVTVNDDGFQQDSDSFDVTVNDVAPTLGLGGNGSTPEGSVYTLTLGGVNDPGADTVSQYVIHWGDGNDQTILAANLPANRQVQHVYTDGNINGTDYTITVDVENEDGNFTSAGSKAITVNNVAPTVPVNGADTVNEGAAYVLTVGAIFDPGQDTPTLYRIDWGDGSAVNEFTPAEYAALLLAGGNVNHTFVDGGNGGTARNIILQVLDEDGTHTAASKSITVNNVAPDVVLTGAAATDEGASYILNLVGSDPAGANDTLSYSINWGDGSALQNLTGAELAALSGNVAHTFADDEDGPVNATLRTISVTVNDGDGGSIQQDKGVTVNNVAPTIALSGNAAVNEGSSYTLTLGTVTDPGTDVVSSYLVKWGDGSSDTYNVTNTLANGLIGYWTGDNNANDSSLTVNNGSFSGSYVPGVNGQAFDLSTGKVSIPDNSAYSFGPDFSVGFWFNVNGANTNAVVFVGQDEGGGGTNKWFIDYNYQNASSFEFHVNGPSSAFLPSIPLPLDNGWNQLTFVKDGNNYSFYLNGNNIGTNTFGGTFPDPNFALMFGEAEGGFAFNGLMDDVVLYNRALTGTEVQNLANSTSGVVNVTHTYADGLSTPTITVDLVDEDGTHTAGSKSITVNNVAPDVVLTGAAATDEGASYILNLVGSDPAGANDTLSYSINWGDGTAQNLSAAQLAALGGNVEHTFADDEDGPVNATLRTISVTVNDGDGGSTQQDKGVTVNNVAPTIALAGAATIETGQTYTLNLGAVTDPGIETVASYIIDWNDGSAAETVGAAGNVTHTFASAGIRTISVAVVDEDGTFANAGALEVTVGTPPATVSLEAGADATLDEGTTFSRTINFTDGTDNGAPGWSYSIDYGDGTAPVTGTTLVKSLELSHQYTDGDANRTVAVTLTDEAGESAADSFQVTVNNVAPVAAVTGADTVAEAGVYTLSVGAVTEPGADTRTGYSIDWGDSSTSNFTPAEWLAAAGSFTHSYADGGNGGTARTITVSTTDEDGSFVLGSKALNVTNVAPTLTLDGNAATNEGSSYLLNIAGADAAGAADPLSYAINWGDGTAVQNLTGAELAALSGNVAHTFTDDEDGPVNATLRTISVTVNDGDGGSTQQNKEVTVNNVAPVAAVTGADTVAEAGVYTLSVGAVTEPGADTRTGYSIDWGDSSTSNFTPAEWLAAAGSFTHSYADGGNGGTARTITVSTTDEDGSFVLGSKALNVTNVAPTLTLDGNAATNEGSSYVLNIVGADVAGAADPLSYAIDWGDGSALQNLTGAELAALSGNVAHTFADDEDGPVNATVRTISVTVNDGDGGSTQQNKEVTVNNVAPVAAVTGADTVAEAGVYTLSVGAVTEPGADTRTGYSIDWGDNSTSNFTPAEWLAAAGSFTHSYADGGNGGTARTITVSTTDEDGSFVLGAKALNVTNVAPTLTLDGNAATNEGSSYVLNIVGADVAGAADPLSYAIDWGDGSAVQNLTGAELAALSGNVAHTFADDEDGPVNATLRTISVTVNDGDGGSTQQDKGVTVNNVAPTIALTGAATIETGQTYTLNLGAVTDPGIETVTGYIIDWNDGSAAETVGAAGNVTHIFAGAGIRTISVAVVDEDGTFANAGALEVTVGTPSATVSLEAGADATLDEGATFNRTINFTDGTDNGAPGWSYSIDYGDGTAPVTGTTLVKSLELSHQYTDGDANRTVAVTLTDEAGESAADSFQVTVNNVAPVAAVTGADTVAEAGVYTLSVGAVTEPGADTRTGYSIDWGDSSTSNFTPAEWLAAAGSFTHSYADGGNGGTARTITVSTTDEDGSFVLGSKALNVTNVAPTLTLDGNAATNEGSSYVLNIVGADVAGAADPLSYAIDWGDGSALQNLTGAELAALSGNVAHTFADDEDGPVNATVRTISVTVNDGDGGSTQQNKEVTVNNVAPVAAVTGADTVAEAGVYTLSVGAVTEPGADTRPGYSIDWGDSSTSNFTAAEWLAAAGSFTHSYADGGNGGTARTLTVSTTDEDGSFVLGSKALNVTNVAPTLALDGNAATNEGSSYLLNIVGADVAGAADPLSYAINWGDGSALQNLTGAELAALSGNVAHTFADDEDGPVNATLRTISVTVNDGDGGSTQQDKGVTVNNVAPTIALSGADHVVEDTAYTLTLGTVSDPGQDHVSSYLINWNDGSPVQTVDTAGNVNHTYANPGNFAISVSLVDEDGTYANVAEKTVSVDSAVQPEIIHLGDAKGIPTLANPNVWAPFWTNPMVNISHKADYTNAGEAWTAAKLNAVGPTTLAGGDLWNGDLGVSGRNAATSSIQQELQGHEALRFQLTDATHIATHADIDLTKFFSSDDGTVNYNEAGRLQALDTDGNVVKEVLFSAANSDGTLSISLDSTIGFSALVLTAGSYDESNHFVFGAYESDSGQAITPYPQDNPTHGSDFLVDSIEVTLIGINPI